MKITKKTAKLLGLSDSEVKIIKTLKKGLTISDLSIQSEIPRTSLYYMLSKLKERGFLYKNRINRKEIWNQTEPEELARLYRDTANLFSAYNSPKHIPEITTLKGSKEMVNVFREIANMPSKSRFYCIQPKLSLINAVDKLDIKDAIGFNKTVKENQLIVEGIIHEKGTEEMIKNIPKDDKKKFLESFSGRSADTVKLPESFLEYTKAEIYYYQDKVAIVNWDKEFAIIIENKDVFELLIEMFKSTKYMLGKYDQNEKIARMLVGD